MLRVSFGGVVGFGLSRILWFSMLMMLVVGIGMMQGMAASNTIIQTVVPEDRRGRVMSYYTMAFVGMAPFGSLLAGGMAHMIPATPMWIAAGPKLAGAQWTVIINGVVVVLGAVWFFTRLPALRRVVRPIYEERESFRRGERWRRNRYSRERSFQTFACSRPIGVCAFPPLQRRTLQGWGTHGLRWIRIAQRHKGERERRVRRAWPPWWRGLCQRREPTARRLR